MDYYGIQLLRGTGIVYLKIMFPIHLGNKHVSFSNIVLLSYFICERASFEVKSSYGFTKIPSTMLSFL